MKINLNTNPKNVERLDAALAKVNGKATGHTYSTSALCFVAAELEARLEALGIPKKDRKGATASAKSGERVPAAYKYKRIGTHATLERGPTDWCVVGLASTYLYEKGGNVWLHLTHEQEALAVAALRKASKYGVKA